MQTAQDFIDSFGSEVGPELESLVDPHEVLRWVNRGQGRLGIYRPKVVPITWPSAATEIVLPADFHHAEKIRFACPAPQHEWFGASLQLTGDSVVAGDGKLFYWAYYPKITGNQDSLLPDEGDDALISFSLYRFYKRLASSRADYRRYATITAQNGVDISELDALSERHFSDFDDARNDLQDAVHAPSAFFGE